MIYNHEMQEKKTLLFRLESLAPRSVRRCIHVVKLLNYDMQRCDLFKHATAMAYVTLFSLVPSLAATFAVISLFKPFLGEDSALLIQVKSFIFSNLATGAGEQLVKFLDQFISNLDMTKIGITGFAGLLFTLIMLLRQIEIALNRIWLVVHPRNVITRFVYFWTFLTLGTLVIGLAFGLVSGFDVARLNPFGEQSLTLGQALVAKITPPITVMLFFTMLYKFVPNTFVPFRFALLGAIFAAALFLLATSAYGWFAPNFTSYQAIYGALAAVPLFLMWLYILWLITLLGALLAWRFEQGFAQKDDLDDQSSLLSAAERLRNQQLQSVVPLASALLVYHNFEQANGEGITGYELAHRLNIPTNWIVESVEFLLQQKIILKQVGSSGIDEGDALKAPLLPAQPAAKVRIDELLEHAQEGFSQWLATWKTDLPQGLHRKIQQLMADPKKFAGQKILDLI